MTVVRGVEAAGAGSPDRNLSLYVCQQPTVHSPGMLLVHLLDPPVPALTGAGAAAVLLGHGLWRGSRNAAVLVGLVLSGLGAVVAATGAHAAVAVLALAGAGTLAVSHRSFRVGAARRGVLLPAALACGGLVVLCAMGAQSRPLDDGLGLARAAASAGIAGWRLVPGVPGVGVDLVTTLTSAAVVMLVWRLLRPSGAAVGHTATEHARAAAIVARHATDSLDPFALREDKCFFFSHGGVLAYRTLRGTAVISGDPVGPTGLAGAILADFDAFAAARGWDVVLTSAGEHAVAEYRRLGFKAVCIGEEAVVDVASFSLTGGAMKRLRQSVTRQGRLGWSIDVLAGSALEAAAVQEIAAVERSWRAAQPRVTGFAMTLGRLWGAAEDDRSLYVTARDPGGRIRAFIRFAEFRGGLSLDVMRRTGEAPNGLNDAMIVAAIEEARRRGLSSVSLNFAGFAHLMTPGRPLTRPERLAKLLLTRAHGRFQLERLVAFNQKFRPQWQPRYLVHREPQRLPVLGLRVLQAEAYLRPPRSRALTARWTPLTLPVAFGSTLQHPAP